MSRIKLSLLPHPGVVQTSNEGRELDDGRKQKEGTSLDAGSGDEERYSDEDAGTWYIGKAKEEFNKRRNGQRLPDRRRVGEEDPIEVCIHHTNNTTSYQQPTVGKRAQRCRAGPRQRFRARRLFRGHFKRKSGAQRKRGRFHGYDATSGNRAGDLGPTIYPDEDSRADEAGATGAGGPGAKTAARW